MSRTGREAYAAIIQKHLDMRGRQQDDFQWDTDFKEAKYVVRMCWELLDEVNANGGKATIEDILKADRSASGHCDYHSKAALYMDELARGIRSR